MREEPGPAGGDQARALRRGLGPVRPGLVPGAAGSGAWLRPGAEGARLGAAGARGCDRGPQRPPNGRSELGGSAGPSRAWEAPGEAPREAPGGAGAAGRPPGPGEGTEPSWERGAGGECRARSLFGFSQPRCWVSLGLGTGCACGGAMCSPPGALRLHGACDRQLKCGFPPPAVRTLRMRDTNGRRKAKAGTSTIKARRNTARGPGVAPPARALSESETRGEPGAERGGGEEMAPSPPCPQSALPPHRVPAAGRSRGSS